MQKKPLDLLENIAEEDIKVGEAIKQFLKLGFYITYKEEVFKSSIRIPISGSLIRQLADVFLLGC